MVLASMQKLGVSADEFGTLKIGDFKVNRLGLGTNQIAANQNSRTILKEALNLGINFIDTAELYGQSEEVIGATLFPYQPGTLIATKGGYSTNAPESLEKAIDNSLVRLKLKQLPLYHLHRIDDRYPVEATMEFLKSQQKAGKIMHIGLSEVSIDQIERARAVVDVVSVQNRYNLVDREHEAVIDYCSREKIVFIPFFPLNSGSLVLNKKLQLMAAKYGATPVQIAIAWLIKRSPIMLPIPGTLSVEHLKSNLGAARLKLSQQDFHFLSEQ